MLRSLAIAAAVANRAIGSGGDEVGLRVTDPERVAHIAATVHRLNAAYIPQPAGVADLDAAGDDLDEFERRHFWTSHHEAGTAISNVSSSILNSGYLSSAILSEPHAGTNPKLNLR